MRRRSRLTLPLGMIAFVLASRPAAHAADDALVRFQKAHGLNADGVVAAATRRALGPKIDRAAAGALSRQELRQEPS